MIDPGKRWAAQGERPEYAGLPTYAGLPYTEDPAELADADVAIVGAPMDELASDAPGTRFGPRAIRAASCLSGRHLEAGIDATEALRIVDFGDAAVVPADPAASHRAIEATVGEVLAAGAIPIVLGGDHSISEPDDPRLRRRSRPARADPLRRPHRHRPGAVRGRGLPRHPDVRLVEDGHVDPRRYAQIGLRGYWPDAEDFDWQRERGIVALLHARRPRPRDPGGRR